MRSSQIRNSVFAGLALSIFSFTLYSCDKNCDEPKKEKGLSANAGADISLVLPNNYTELRGSGDAPEGWITGYEWTKISGPASSSYSDVKNAALKVSDLVQGRYTFELKVTDNNMQTAKDQVNITVLTKSDSGRDCDHEGNYDD